MSPSCVGLASLGELTYPGDPAAGHQLTDHGDATRLGKQQRNQHQDLHGTGLSGGARRQQYADDHAQVLALGAAVRAKL